MQDGPAHGCRGDLLGGDGFHRCGYLVRKPVEMQLQPVIHFALDGIGSKVADQRGLGRVHAKLFD